MTNYETAAEASASLLIAEEPPLVGKLWTKNVWNFISNGANDQAIQHLLISLP